MKMEWNNNGFFTNTNNEPLEKTQADATSGLAILRENGTIILSIIAFICAVANLLFGLFLNFSADFVTHFFDNNAWHWIIVLIIFSIILFSIAVLSGIFSIIFYKKSRKNTIDSIGVIFSILAFIIAFSGIILNIVALIV